MSSFSLPRPRDLRKAVRLILLAFARLAVLLWPAAGPIVLLLILAGCQSVPVATALALRNTDPLAVRAVDLAALLVHSDDLRFADGNATLTLTAKDPSVDLLIEERFALAVQESASPDSAVPDGSSAVTSFALAPDDHEAFDRIVAKVRAIRDERRSSGAKRSRSGSFTMAVNGRPCVSAGSEPRTRADVFLRVAEDGPFRAIQKDIDLAGDVPLPRCAQED